MTNACGVKRNIVTKRWTLTTVAGAACCCDVHEFRKCFGLYIFCGVMPLSSSTSSLLRFPISGGFFPPFVLVSFQLKPIIWLSKFPTNYVISCTCEWIYELIWYFSVSTMFARRTANEKGRSGGRGAAKLSISRLHSHHRTHSHV